MKKKLKNNILNKIEKGELKMRSRLSVFLEKLGIGSSMVVLFLGLIILAGVISYWFKLNNDLIFGGYGKYGLRIFTQTFPYILVLSFICLFFLLSLLLRKFDFSYKKSFISILSFILGLALVFGWVSLKNPIGRKFYQKEGRFLRIGRMENNSNSISGQVLQIYGNNLIINTYDGKSVMVKTSNNTHYPFGFPKIRGSVRTIGKWNGDNFEAVGIRVFNEDDIGGMIRGYGQGGIMNGQSSGTRWSK